MKRYSESACLAGQYSPFLLSREATTSWMGIKCCSYTDYIHQPDAIGDILFITSILSGLKQVWQDCHSRFCHSGHHLLGLSNVCSAEPFLLNKKAQKPTTDRDKFNSRSYAEDVTSVTSGASQGPHSFNLFVCLFVCVCVTPGAIPYLSRTEPYHQTQLATYSWPQYSNRAFKRKIIT